jgi:hypothetical protein
MSYYSNDEHMCRVDFWKPSGKWYMTECVSFGGLYKEPLIHDAFIKALETADLTRRFSGFTVTCLDPYHEHSHPISLVLK